MTAPRARQIEDLYAAFNRRDIDSVLAAMAEDVRWPNGWEGGTMTGRHEVRRYWERQWGEIDPTVEPVGLAERPDGATAVHVHQVVRNKDGALIAERELLHVYRFDGDAIAEMVIEEIASGSGAGA